jgi:predicted DNA-binding transcriptional regulator AlpA
MTYEEAARTHPIVMNHAQGRFTAEQTIALLATQSASLYEAITKLEAIVPKVYRVGGKLVRWDAPTELLDVEEIKP